MPTTFKQLNGVAIKGLRSQPHMAFVEGVINGDNMTLVFASQNRIQISPRRWKTQRTMMFVPAKRQYSPSKADFWWQVVDGSRQMTYDL